MQRWGSQRVDARKKSEFLSFGPGSGVVSTITIYKFEVVPDGNRVKVFN